MEAISSQSGDLVQSCDHLDLDRYGHVWQVGGKARHFNADVTGHDYQLWKIHSIVPKRTVRLRERDFRTDVARIHTTYAETG